MSWSLFFLIITVASWIYWVTACWCVISFFREPQPEADPEAPPVSLLKPMCGVDAEAYENLRLLGRITGREAQAEAAIRKTENKIADYRAKTPRNERPIVLKMWGTGQLFGIDPIESVYGSVLAEVTNYPWRTPPNTSDAGGGDGRIAYSLEEILRVNPDVLIIADLDAGFGGPPFTNQFKDNPIWAQITAVKTNRILMGNVTTYLNTRGTRAFRLMLDEVMPSAYPTLFPQPLPDRER
ncbi:MAG: ABC transporter substrate-binding protein [Chloroflexi bacterium]|nr:ABC transporter substrate-binding protein [Chloroflexota bacterium]